MLKAAELKPMVGGDWTRARILQQLLEWTPTTNLTDDQGRKIVRPILSNMARRIGLKPSAISKVMKWLQRHGFITITKVLIGRIWRLQIRVLIRIKDTVRTPSGHSAGHRQDIVYLPNTPDKPIPRDTGVTSPPNILTALKGSLSGVADRVREKQEVSRNKEKEKPPTPLRAAHEWVRILGEYGYQLFDPNDGKHLKHIKTTITNTGAKTLGEFVTEIERRVGMWQNHRPALLRKAPPHPWALNRTDVLFQTLETQAPDTDDDDYGTTPLVPTPIAGTQKVDKPDTGGLEQGDTQKQKPNAFLAAIHKGKGK